MSHFFYILFLVWFNVMIYSMLSAGIYTLSLREGKSISLQIISVVFFWFFIITATLEIIYLG